MDASNGEGLIFNIIYSLDNGIIIDIKNSPMGS